MCNVWHISKKKFDPGFSTVFFFICLFVYFILLLLLLFFFKLHSFQTESDMERKRKCSTRDQGSDGVR